MALVLYFVTAAPGLTWANGGADGGDHLAAALVRGVPHPTGYPTYQLLLRVAIALYPGEPARAGNLFSAFCAALAVALIATTARRMVSEITPWPNLVAFSAGLVLATTPALWGQATITEAYTLHALFLALLLWLLWSWREVARLGRPAGRWLLAVGLCLGLGLGVHLTLLLELPGVLAWFWTNRRMLSATSSSWRVASLLAVPAGLGTYFYLVRAAAGHPPVNWGNPETLGQLAWLASGRLYAGLAFGVPPDAWPARLAALAADLLQSLAGGPWGAVIALVGLWKLDRADHAWWQLTVLVALMFALFALGYRATDSQVYLLPAWLVSALWLAVGIAWGANRLATGMPAIRTIVPLGILVLGVVPALRFWSQMDLRYDHEARDYMTSVLAEADPESIVLTATDGPTFALWYAAYGLEQRPDLMPVNVNLYDFPWYRETLARWHPRLAGFAGGGDLPQLDRLLEAAAPHVPIYRVEPLGAALGDAVERQEGALVRLELP